MKDNRALLEALGLAVRCGERDLLQNALHDNVELTLHGPPQAFPVPTAMRGKRAVVAAIRVFDEAVRVIWHSAKVRMVDGDRAAVIAHRTAIQRATGRMLTYKVAIFLRMQDERIIELEAFYDSFDIVQQATGHSLDVPQGYPR